MNEIEKYLFDLNGFILVKGCLEVAETRKYLEAVDEFEPHIAKHIDDEPQFVGFAGIRYRFDEQYQCNSYKFESGGGLQYIVDDFLNASTKFDSLVLHEKTMGYVKETISGPVRIGNSELRLRYKANQTDTHMGGRMDIRNRFQFVGQTMYHSAESEWRSRDFDLVALRVLYALHDVPVENGPLCVVPGSHKSNFFSPFSDLAPTDEPGMVPIPMEAGDAIFFTENLRHGGFPNLIDRPRKTLHLMFGPVWAGSQSPVHWDKQVHVSEHAWSRYSEAQRQILPPPAHTSDMETKRLKHENSKLKLEIERLRANLTAARNVAEQVPPLEAK